MVPHEIGSHTSAIIVVLRSGVRHAKFNVLESPRALENIKLSLCQIIFNFSFSSRQPTSGLGRFIVGDVSRSHTR